MAIAICGDTGSFKEVIETYLFDAEYGTADSAKYMKELLLDTARTSADAIESAVTDKGEYNDNETYYEERIESCEKNISSLKVELKEIRVENSKLREAK